ncbi:MAG: RidA family protein [Chloroflexi bacterium]|nr:RidA family protein [Chloroflexota bacterium]
MYPEGGPKPGGPYSPAIVSGGFVFLAGQVGNDPATGKLAGDTIEAQARQTMKNLGTLLKAAGCDFKDVVKVNAYITNAEFFQEFNSVYREYFVEPYPARSTVVCALVNPGLLLEVDLIAKIPEV